MFYIWHLKHDNKKKHDMWHLTSDTWQLAGWEISWNVRSLILMVLGKWCFEDIFTNDESVSQSMNHKAVCRTALATQGLSNIYPSLFNLDLPLEQFWFPHYADQLLAPAEGFNPWQKNFWPSLKKGLLCCFCPLYTFVQLLVNLISFSFFKNKNYQKK